MEKKTERRMKRKNKQTKKVFSSWEEVKEAFLPNLYKEETKEKKFNQPELFGTALATEILEKIRQKTN